MNTSRHLPILLAILLMVDGARACSVPVFRYALEHWYPDDYEALVFHRGELDVVQQKLVNRLRGEPGGARANLDLKVIDLDADDSADWLPVWKLLGGEELPGMVVRPDPRNAMPWLRISLPLDEENVSRLLDSPARREIAARIGAGDSVIWLFLESGSEARDAAAVKLLDERIAYLESVMELPELSAADIANGLVSVGADGLKLKFSRLRVSRDDPAEAFFVQMLLGIESDLAELDGPMVFPVLGQGRALPPLVAKGISNPMIDEQAIYLVGSCSCEVKDQNPGVDLLMTADWVGMVKRQAAESPVLPEASEVAAVQPVTVTFSNKPPEVFTNTAAREGTVDFDYAIPLALLIIAGVAFSIRGR